MMEKENKKTYMAPQLAVVEFKTERGYAASGGLDGKRNSYGEANQGDGTQQDWF